MVNSWLLAACLQVTGQYSISNSYYGVFFFVALPASPIASDNGHPLGRLSTEPSGLRTSRALYPLNSRPDSSLLRTGSCYDPLRA